MTEADCGNDASGVGDSLVVVAAIGEDISHEGIKCAGSAEEGDETVAALNARGMQLVRVRAARDRASRLGQGACGHFSAASYRADRGLDAGKSNHRGRHVVSHPALFEKPYK